MAISLQSDADGDGVVSAINTTPLVDVMLVLLIIFLITIPVVTHTIPVALPKEVNQPLATKPENINISVARDGKVYWNEQLLSDGQELTERLKKNSVMQPQPVVQIRGDGDVAYAPVGRVILACQKAGIQKIGFVTEPPSRG